MIQKEQKDTLTKTVRISSRYMNIGKLDIIKEHDKNVIALKNEMSLFVYEHLDELLKTKFLTFVNKYYKQFEGVLFAWETQKLFMMICRQYLVVVDRYIKNTRFDVQVDIYREYYVRNTKKHNKGDSKDCHAILKPCSLSGLLKYLLYVNDFDNISNKDIVFRLDSYDEYKRNKIIDYAKQKKADILAEILLIYKTGTYIKQGIISKAKNAEIKNCLYEDVTNSKYQYWYAFKLLDKIVHLPLMINPEYHKDMYNKDKEHYVKFVGDRVDILATREVEKPHFNTMWEVVGIDINVVNNFISCSDGYILDYDREYIDRMFKLVKKIDAVGYNNMSKNMRRQFTKLIRQNEWYFQRLIHEFLMYCVKNGKTDVVMEDLLFADKSWIRDEATQLKYSRIVKLLRLSNIKNWLKSQAEKMGIRVHLTLSHYTSQQCPVCGHIDRANRPTQEKFECKNCGHADNADHNASVNIKNRFTVNVLRESKKIHSFDEYGRMIPYSKNKTIIKQVLLSVFDT